MSKVARPGARERSIDSTADDAAQRWVLFLRGINVGGKHTLPMKRLAALATKAGGANVETYIQSGNAVFTAAKDVAEALPPILEKLIEAEFGFGTPVVLRSADALQRVIKGHPWAAAGAGPKACHVVFLKDPPARADAERLDPGRSPGDSFAWLGQEVFLHLPNGTARSKLTNDYFDRTLKTVGTIRNWATVKEMARRAAGGSGDTA
jgi:uncharacterized protein (DUF1697 family)